MTTRSYSDLSDSATTFDPEEQLDRDIDERMKGMSDEKWLCPKCKRRERENIEGDLMWYCGPCNDRDYERYQERAEWEHYHPAKD